MKTTKKQRVLIIGAQGHAKVILDILTENGYEIAGLIDDFTVHEIAGYKVIGTTGDLKTLHVGGVAETAFVAVGDNASRKRLTRLVCESGLALVNAVSTHSIVSKWAEIGSGCAVMPGAVVNAFAHVGEGAVINTGASVDHDCTVGEFTHVAPGVVLTGNVEVGEGAFLGAGTVVIPKIHIGRWAVTGAGSVLLHDVPDYDKVAGVPAVSLQTGHPSDGGTCSCAK